MGQQFAVDSFAFSSQTPCPMMYNACPLRYEHILQALSLWSIILTCIWMSHSESVCVCVCVKRGWWYLCCRTLLQATNRDACMPTDNNSSSDGVITWQTSADSQSRSRLSVSRLHSSWRGMAGLFLDAVYAEYTRRIIHAGLDQIANSPVLPTICPQAAFDCDSDPKNIAENQQNGMMVKMPQ